MIIVFCECCFIAHRMLVRWASNAVSSVHAANTENSEKASGKSCQKCRRLQRLTQVSDFAHAGGCVECCSRLRENGENIMSTQPKFKDFIDVRIRLVLQNALRFRHIDIVFCAFNGITQAAV